MASFLGARTLTPRQSQFPSLGERTPDRDVCEECGKPLVYDRYRSRARRRFCDEKCRYRNRDRKRYEADPDRERARSRAYYAANREKVLAKAQARRDALREGSSR
jgi:hypothetical protein